MSLDTITEEDFNYCFYRYKDSCCNYDGEIPECNKTITDCKRHDNFKNWPLQPLFEFEDKENNPD